MAARFLAWLKNRPRFALAILFVGAYSYAIDPWFLSGVVDSKWIGLPQYEQAMKELQEQSRNRGIVALALGIVAFVLILPHWPARSKIEATHETLTASPEGNIWIEYLGQCVLRAGIILFGTDFTFFVGPLACSPSRLRMFSPATNFLGPRALQ